MARAAAAAAIENAAIFALPAAVAGPEAVLWIIIISPLEKLAEYSRQQEVPRKMIFLVPYDAALC
ncbi:MAG: hypothetical protein WD359_03340 [Dehalococcoidia bacterium]